MEPFNSIIAIYNKTIYYLFYFVNKRVYSGFQFQLARKLVANVAMKDHFIHVFKY